MLWTVFYVSIFCDNTKLFSWKAWINNTSVAAPNNSARTRFQFPQPFTYSQHLSILQHSSTPNCGIPQILELRLRLTHLKQKLTVLSQTKKKKKLKVKIDYVPGAPYRYTNMYITEFVGLSVTKTRKILQLLKIPDFPLEGTKRQQTILIYSGHGNYPGKRLFSDEGVSRGALFVVWPRFVVPGGAVPSQRRQCLPLRAKAAYLSLPHRIHYLPTYISTHLSHWLTTPRSTDLEMLTLPQPVEKFHGTRRFITMFTRNQHLSPVYWPPSSATLTYRHRASTI